jgi:hypothetical protein
VGGSSEESGIAAELKLNVNLVIFSIFIILLSKVLKQEKPFEVTKRGKCY